MPRSRTRLRDFDPTDQHRLVVNPFLAAFALFALGCMAEHWGFSTGIPILLFLIVALGGSTRLVQFHCLDCGRTGSYRGRKGHACPAVLARHQSGEWPGFPAVSPRMQLVFWVYALGSAAVLYAVFALLPSEH